MSNVMLDWIYVRKADEDTGLVALESRERDMT